jgi:hypothetical protein
VIDTALVSLSHDTFALKGGPLSRRDHVDFFSAIAWSREVAIQAGVEPLTGLVNWYLAGDPRADGRRKRVHRQWSERFRGRRSPSPKLIAEMDAKGPGSSATWSLAVWPALRVDAPLSWVMEEVQKRLPAAKSRAFGQLLRPAGSALPVCPWAYRTPVLSMALSASLDDLACLLVMLRTSIDLGCERMARLFAEHVFLVLLVQAPWLMDHGLLVPLGEYVDRHFFQKVGLPYVSWLSEAHYRVAVASIAQTLVAAHMANEGVVPHEAWKPCVLRSVYAWDVVTAMDRRKARKSRH